MKSIRELISMKDKDILITGGAGYLGSAMCETLAELGGNLAIASRDKIKCESFAEQIRKRYGTKVVSLSIDITNLSSVHAAFESAVQTFGQVDVLINNE